MAGAPRIYVDANVVIRAFESHDDLSIELSGLFELPPRGRPVVTTSQLTYAEAIQRPLATDDRLYVQLYERWLADGTKWLALVPIDAAVLRTAAVMRTRIAALKLPDAIHVASALEAGCTHLVTGDRRLGRSIEATRSAHPGLVGMTVLEPAAAAVRALMEALR